MPKEITHWTIADMAASKTRSTAAAHAVKKYRNLYYLGAVVFDTPYYGAALPGYGFLKDIGDKLHGSQGENTFEPLQSMLDQFMATADDRLLAFALGAITHVVVDSQFHPLIYYYTGNYFDKDPRKRRAAMANHARFEVFLDLHYYGRLKLINDGSMAKTIRGTGMDLGHLSSLVSLLFFSKRGANLPTVRRSLRMHGRLQTLFTRPLARRISSLLTGIETMGRFTSLCYPRMTAIDAPFFSRKIEYRHPVTGDACRRSIADLEDGAITRILELFDTVCAEQDAGADVNPLAELCGPSLESGLLNSTGDQMKYFNTDVVNELFEELGARLN